MSEERIQFKQDPENETREKHKWAFVSDKRMPAITSKPQDSIA